MKGRQPVIFAELMILSVGLSMDACAVAICKGACMRRLEVCQVLKLTVEGDGFCVQVRVVVKQGQVFSCLVIKLASDRAGEQEVGVHEVLHQASYCSIRLSRASRR